MKLAYVPREEFARVLDLVDDAHLRHALFADLCRLNTLYMIMRAGSGHIGTSFSSLDLVSWILLEEVRPWEDGERAIYFSSKGHDAPALYAALIALGALDFDLLHRLRRLDGLPGHPDVSTPRIVTNTGSLGMGVSKAKGMVIANRLAGQRVPVFVLTGDGELQEGQFWESLPSAAHAGMGEITVIVDHNKLQSDTFVSRVNDLGDLEARLASHGWHVVRADGHDPATIARTFADLRSVQDRPKAWIADTIKGKGVSFMEHTALSGEQWLYRYHSGAPSEADYARALEELLGSVNRRLLQVDQPEARLVMVELPSRQPPPRSAQRLVAAYSEALVQHAERDRRIVALDGDLMVDCGLLPFRERFPDRFVEAGIAEQDMVSMAGGMALRGLLPIVHSFACFLSTRPNEQIYNNATERTRIIYAASLAGLIPAGPGHSHQCVRDISSLGSIPGLAMIQPSCADEVKMALAYAVDGTSESCYLRLFTPPIELPYSLPADYRLVVGQGARLTPGDDVILFAYGPALLSEAVRAARLLAREGIGLAVYNLPWLNRLDSAWLAEVVSGFQALVTVDDHYVVGGQGDMILSVLASHGRPFRGATRKLGVVDVPRCGTTEEVLAAHGLDADGIATSVRALVGAPAASGTRSKG